MYMRSGQHVLSALQYTIMQDDSLHIKEVPAAYLVVLLSKQSHCVVFNPLGLIHYYLSPQIVAGRCCTAAHPSSTSRAATLNGNSLHKIISMQSWLHKPDQ